MPAQQDQRDDAGHDRAEEQRPPAVLRDDIRRQQRRDARSRPTSRPADAPSTVVRIRVGDVFRGEQRADAVDRADAEAGEKRITAICQYVLQKAMMTGADREREDGPPDDAHAARSDRTASPQ